VVAITATRKLGVHRNACGAPDAVSTSAETGKVMIVSLWETREQMPAGVQDQARPATGLTPPHLETYEVAMHA
jgi:heme-degrading monooxygenase HmoA